jgi:hypothetical protein
MLATLAGGTLPAVAATSTVYVIHGYDSRNQTPLAFDTFFTGCETPRPEPHLSANTMYNTSTPSSLGSAFWAVEVQQPDLANGPSVGFDDLSDFTSASLDVLNQNPSGGASEGARLYAFVRGKDGTQWSGLANIGTVAAGTGWQTVSADSSAVFTWLHYPAITQDLDPPISEVPFTGTLAQLQSQQDLEAGGRIGISMGCEGGPFGFDKPTFSQGNTSVTLDLETSGVTAVDGGPVDFLIIDQDSDQIDCSLRDDDYYWYEQGDLTLQAKPAGSHIWTDVQTVAQKLDPTDKFSNGLPMPARFSVTPDINTAYRCIYAGTYPGISLPEPVLVADRIWAHPRSVVVRRGQNIVIRGRVLPVVPGRRITLYNYTTTTALAHTKLDAAGRFRLAVPATDRGELNLVVATRTTDRHVGNATGPFLIRVVRP